MRAYAAWADTFGAVKVAGLWRYPVKSMRGEKRESLEVSELGIKHDRHFGVLDAQSGTIISAKKDGRLLQARAMLAGVELTIRLPTGETVLAGGPAVDAALSDWLGRPVHLVEARREGRGTYQMPVDFEDDESEPHSWQGPAGSFVDSSPIHVLTTASLRAMTSERPDLQWAVARFRPNILVDAEGDDCAELDWVDRKIVLGDVVLRVMRPCSRCVMTTRDQPGGIERQLDVLRHIQAQHEAALGVLAEVVRGGTVAAGQTVTLEG
jgi:uncharacterized protein YcbX